jgi:methylated-DNA-protein-cysteine methyltransferase-like protein
MSREKIYAVVRRIPRGRVATYGQVAELAGLPGHARQVGYAMAALPAGTTVPWQRVINAAGMVSRRRMPGEELTQRQLLEKEGINFDARGRVALEKVQWRRRRRHPPSVA